MATKKRSGLIILSNRGPIRRRNGKWVRSSGGLVTALDPVLRSRGGVWVSAAEGDEEPSVEDLGYRIGPVRLPRGVQNRFYAGFSNAILWPLLHSFPPTIRVGEAPWEDYVSANRAFADAALASLGNKRSVWVQDYHLMLASRMLREKRPKLRIGWFCHVPWPAPDLFAILPWRRALLDGLLAADLIGFHTDAYRRNFLDCAHRLTDHEVDFERSLVRTPHGDTRIVTAPIGIPLENVQRLIEDPKVLERQEAIADTFGERKIILGVDRLDYTKGIPERLLGYEKLLSRKKSIRDQCVMVQVMVPSRTDVSAYAALKAEIDRLVGRINGRFGRTGRMPIHYLYRSLDAPELYAHYRAADAALVTPLRDGMNLVAQEYVAAHTDDRGALILSEFAGAADHLEDALLVNPYDIDGIADALDEALTARPDALAVRMRAMRASVSKLDVHQWANDFLEALEREEATEGRPRRNGRAGAGSQR